MNKLEQHVLEMIGENTSSPDVFLNTTDGLEPIRDSINDAIQEIATITGGQKKEYIIPLTQDATFYRLKFTQDQFGWITDCWHIANQWRLRQTDIHKENRENPRWMDYTGDPERYMQVGLDIIGVVPRPPGVGTVLNMTCVVIPDPYETSTDRIKLRESFEWAVVHYAVGEYYAGRGDRREGMVHHQKFLEKLGLQEHYPESSEYQYRKRS